MTLAQIRNRIHALQRRFGLPLAIIRLRPYATQFCHQWAVAQDQQADLSPRLLSSSGSLPTPGSVSPPSCTFTTISRGTSAITPAPTPKASSALCCPMPQPVKASSTPFSTGTMLPRNAVPQPLPTHPCSASASHFVPPSAPMRPDQPSNRRHPVAMHSPRSYNSDNHLQAQGPIRFTFEA